MDVGLLLIIQHNCLQMVICPQCGRTKRMAVRFQLLSRDVQHQLEVELRSFKISFTTHFIPLCNFRVASYGKTTSLLKGLTFFSLIFSHSISCFRSSWS